MSEAADHPATAESACTCIKENSKHQASKVRLSKRDVHGPGLQKGCAALVCAAVDVRRGVRLGRDSCRVPIAGLGIVMQCTPCVIVAVACSRLRDAMPLRTIGVCSCMIMVTTRISQPHCGLMKCERSERRDRVGLLVQTSYLGHHSPVECHNWLPSQLSQWLLCVGTRQPCRNLPSRRRYTSDCMKNPASVSCP